MNPISTYSYLLRSRLKGLHRHVWPGQHQLQQSRGARILIYHGICRQQPLQYNTLFITQKSFERQLLFFKKHFQVVALQDFIDRRYNPSRFTLCLTFDDGFANNLHYALPLLEQYQIPATFFITAIRKEAQDILWNDQLCLAYAHGPATFSIDHLTYKKNNQGRYVQQGTAILLADELRTKNNAYRQKVLQQLGCYKHAADEDYWMQLTPEQIKTMAASKWVTIGSHSYFHNDLATLDSAALQFELSASKLYLEELTGKAVQSIAFPYGSYNALVLNEALQAGYTQLLAADHIFPGDEQHPALQQRFTINPFISTINQMHAIVKGKY